MKLHSQGKAFIWSLELTRKSPDGKRLPRGSSHPQYMLWFSWEHVPSTFSHLCLLIGQHEVSNYVSPDAYIMLTIHQLEAMEPVNHGLKPN